MHGVQKMTTIIDNSVSGSFLCITQFCNTCMHKRMWQSQPHIGNIPAGNILTSAAILYTGSLPAKALRIFMFLNCPTISSSTFFRHQSSYLQPAINVVWLCHQSMLLSKFKESKVKLQVGGDSAKYGTYSLIQLSCNQIIDFQLVQVK